MRKLGTKAARWVECPLIGRHFSKLYFGFWPALGRIHSFKLSVSQIRTRHEGDGPRRPPAAELGALLDELAAPADDHLRRRRLRAEQLLRKRGQRAHLWRRVQRRLQGRLSFASAGCRELHDSRIVSTQYVMFQPEVGDRLPICALLRLEGPSMIPKSSRQIARSGSSTESHGRLWTVASRATGGEAHNSRAPSQEKLHALAQSALALQNTRFSHCLGPLCVLAGPIAKKSGDAAPLG